MLRESNLICIMDLYIYKDGNKFRIFIKTYKNINLFLL